MGEALALLANAVAMLGLGAVVLGILGLVVALVGIVWFLVALWGTKKRFEALSRRNKRRRKEGNAYADGAAHQ